MTTTPRAFVFGRHERTKMPRPPAPSTLSSFIVWIPSVTAWMCVWDMGTFSFRSSEGQAVRCADDTEPVPGGNRIEWIHHHKTYPKPRCDTAHRKSASPTAKGTTASTGA